MPRAAKSAPRPPRGHTSLTAQFRHNLEALMHAHRDLATQVALASVSKVSQRSISRILAAEQSPTLDIVHKLAHAFDLEAWQMLVPGLEPNNPPITKQIDDRQRELFDRFTRAAQDLAAYKSEPTQ